MTDLILHFKKLSGTQNPPFTQKALGVWKLAKANPFKEFRPPSDVFLGLDVSAIPTCEQVGCKVCEEHVSTPSRICANCKHENCRYLVGVAGWPGKKYPNVKMFGRPCPEVPRHGFVESVVVAEMEECKQLFKRALSVDPKAEMLVMPYIEAAASGIFVPESGVVVIGPGHDGATAGRKSILLPVVTQTVDAALKKEIGIPKHQHLYAELVTTGSEDAVTIVQARAGDAIPGSKEYIPRKMAIGHIISPTDDLLAWEALCKALRGTPDVVCHHPGGSLACHAAIHCRSNDIPYLTRENAAVGDVLEPEAIKVPAFNLSEFVLGASYAVELTINREQLTKALRTSISIMYNVLRLEYSEHYSRLLGFAATTLFRASAVACLGEARHYKKADPNKLDPNRNTVYQLALKMPNTELVNRLAAFSYKFVHNSWSSSFGGWPWFSALIQTVKLWNMISTGKHAEILAEANILLDLAHNGGWLFNKFLDNSILDHAKEQPGATFAAQMIPLWDLIHASPELIPIKPRKVRVSKKWSVGTETLTSGKQTPLFILTINKLTWCKLELNGPVKKVLEDMYNNI